MSTGRYFAWWPLVVVGACQRQLPETKSPVPESTPLTPPSKSPGRDEPNTAPLVGECTFSQVSATLALVHPTLEPSLTLRLSDARVQAIIGENDKVIRIRVRGPLVFEATLPSAELRLAPSAKLQAGAFQAGTGAVFVPVQVRGPEAVGRVALGPYSLDNAQVRCADLLFGDGNFVEANPVWNSLPAFQSRLSRLQIFETSQSSNVGASLVLEPWPIVSGEHEKPGWVRIQSAWTDSSKLSGYAKAEDLKPLPAEDRGGGIGTGVSLCRAECRATAPGAPAEKSVRIRAGASIWSAPSGALWATVADSMVARGIPAGSEWVQVTWLEKIAENVACDSMIHAYVRKEDIDTREEN